MVQDTKARLPIEFDTRDRVKALKRGGESYDDLLRKWPTNMTHPTRDR